MLLRAMGANLFCMVGPSPQLASIVPSPAPVCLRVSPSLLSSPPLPLSLLSRPSVYSPSSLSLPSSPLSIPLSFSVLPSWFVRVFLFPIPLVTLFATAVLVMRLVSPTRKLLVCAGSFDLLLLRVGGVGGSDDDDVCVSNRDDVFDAELVAEFSDVCLAGGGIGGGGGGCSGRC